MSCTCQSTNHHCRLIPRLIGKWKCSKGNHEWRMHFWKRTYGEVEPMQERCDRCGMWGFKPGQDAREALIEALIRGYNRDEDDAAEDDTE